MKLKFWMGAVSAGLFSLLPVFAADITTHSTDAAEIEALKRHIQLLDEKVRKLEQQREAEQPTNADAVIHELDQKVRILERRQELEKESTSDEAGKAPRLSLGTGGFNLTSADTNFSISLHGYMQLDSRTFIRNAAPGVDGFILRRVRPIISGTVFHDFEFLFMPDFGGSSPTIYDAWVNYRPWPELQLQAGRFKSPVGLERLQSAKCLSFNERSLVTDLVPNRDLGIELHGDLFNGKATYAAGIFNGVADEANTANSDIDNDKEFAGRLFFEPFKRTGIEPLQGLGFGAAGSYGKEYGSGGLTSGYTTDGQQKFFTYTNGVVASGAHWRVSPQACYYWGPFGLLGEYVISDQQVAGATRSADLQNRAWEVTANWVLTGEQASYDGVKPRHPFTLHKGSGWGAWELVGRYSELDVDDAAFPSYANLATSASEARAWSVGLNWWLNRNAVILASFSRTTFTGGTRGSVTKDPEEVFFTRIQLAF